MSEDRLDSGHFEVPSRRQAYRRAREKLLEERGWLTLAGERLQGMIPADAEWVPLLPFCLPLAPTAKFHLIDRQTSQIHPLGIGLNTIGRLNNNDIVFTERVISRRHCVLVVHSNNACQLHDTASRNGTYVNGRRVQQPVDLVLGDLIQIGKKQLYFVSVEEYSNADDPELAEGTLSG
jgi:hypothetical protein